MIIFENPQALVDDRKGQAGVPCNIDAPQCAVQIQLFQYEFADLSCCQAAVCKGNGAGRDRGLLLIQPLAGVIFTLPGIRRLCDAEELCIKSGVFFARGRCWPVGRLVCRPELRVIAGFYISNFRRVCGPNGKFFVRCGLLRVIRVVVRWMRCRLQ